MISKQFIIRQSSLLLFLLIECKAIAQGWVTDEVSKDNSGGFFSGIIGLVLLLGLIWIIGYGVDKIKDDKFIRNRNKNVQEYKNSQQKSAPKPTGPKVKTEDIIVKMLHYDGKDYLADKDQSAQLDVLPSIDDLAFIDKEKASYELTDIRQNEKEDACKNWGKPENKEYESWYDGEALYSVDGKKIISFEDRTDGHEMKNGVEIICDEAFQRMPNSWKGPFPSSIKVLGNCLYSYSCDNNYIIPESVEIITGNPFANCLGGQIDCLSPHFVYDDNGILYDKERKKVISVMWSDDIEEDKIHIDPNVVMIGRFSFNLVLIGKNKTLSLPPSVLFIGENAFKASWMNIVLSWGTIEIGNSAFAESHITCFKMPASISKIGIAAFAKCRLLESITISPNIEVLDESTFYECERLNHVYIPNGVKIIKGNCFFGCKSLNEVWFPNSIKKIEKNAFSGCPLTTVVLSKNTIIEEGAFPNTCIIQYRS